MLVVVAEFVETNDREFIKELKSIFLIIRIKILNKNKLKNTQFNCSHIRRQAKYVGVTYRQKW